MPLLSNADRQEVRDRWMRENNSAMAPLTKAELRAAVDAIDQWADDNAAEFNLAIPVAARTALTARQKAWLLFFVIRRRFEVA